MPVKTALYEQVPKDRHDNLAWRLDLYRAARRDVALQNALKEMCANDLLYYINAFGWIYDPKKGERLPWVTWDIQDEHIRRTLEAIENQHDLYTEKTREMAATWNTVVVFEWIAHFQHFKSFMMLSRNQRLVESTDNPDALFWKLDFFIQHLPPWLQPRIQRREMHRKFLDTSSVIDGEPTTGDAGRGGRRLATLGDEFAAVKEAYDVLSATRDQTNCRLFVSTHKGVGTAFYEQLKLARPEEKCRLDWKDHPEKAAGLWYDEVGETVKHVNWPRWRSPWYDEQCRRAATAMEIRQEVDIDPIGSSHTFFNIGELEGIIKRDARPPLWEGFVLHEDGAPLRLVEQAGGPLKLWIPVAPTGQPLTKPRTVIGVDIASGSGASNSSASLANVHTGEKFGEFTSARVTPEEFAEICAALGWMFRFEDRLSATIIYERNGFGKPYGIRLQRLGYPALYLEREDRTISQSVTAQPGWRSDPQRRKDVLSAYRNALGKWYINRSEYALAECREYIYCPIADDIQHARQSTNPDPSGAKSSHADRVIADALTVKYMIEEAQLDKKPKVESKPQVAPVNSFAWRREQRRREEKARAW